MSASEISQSQHEFNSGRPQAEAEPSLNEPGRWLSLRDAAEETGISLSALRKWARRGIVASCLVPGPTGTQRLVKVEDVLARAALTIPERRAPPVPELSTIGYEDDAEQETSPAETEHNQAPSSTHGVLVPRDSWDRLLDQLGQLHQAGKELAEARERAARAEEREQFQRERLGEQRERAEREVQARLQEADVRRQAEQEMAALREQLAEAQGRLDEARTRRRWWQR